MKRIVLVVWLGGVLVLLVALAIIRLFGISTAKDVLLRQILVSLTWPITVLFSTGRNVLGSIIKDSQR